MQRQAKGPQRVGRGQAQKGHLGAAAGPAPISPIFFFLLTFLILGARNRKFKRNKLSWGDIDDPVEPIVVFAFCAAKNIAGPGGSRGLVDYEIYLSVQQKL